MVEELKTNLQWKLFKKRGQGHDDLSLVKIKHIKCGKDKRRGVIIFRKDISSVVGEYKEIEILYDKGFLGLKFLKEPTDESYTPSNHSKRKHIIASAYFLNFAEKKYFEKDIKLDVKNKVIVIPIQLVKGKIGFNQYDFVTGGKK